MTTLAIEVEQLTKIYRLYRSPKDRLREMVSLSGKKYYHEFHALRDVSFTVERGETVGIIGQNGSGKSTLLKVICGIVRPTSGRVVVNGRVSSLLELGAGFHPEFTGRENVYMNGALMGLSRDEMDGRFPDIESFADIGEFIDQPVKMYSSGMYVRLAFATAIQVDPDILVIDEALSVGDLFFQAKCTERIRTMIESGLTLLFVSHDLGAVKSLCKKCLLLGHDHEPIYDRTEEVVAAYFARQLRSGREASPDGHRGNEQRPERSWGTESRKFERRASFERIQNGKASFSWIRLVDPYGQELDYVDYEQEVVLQMGIEVSEDLPSLAFSYHIRDKQGVSLVYSDSFIENSSIDQPRKGDRYAVEWRFTVSLIRGSFTIACFLSVPVDIARGEVDCCDYVPIAVQFRVRDRSGGQLYGGVHWKNSLSVSKVS